MPDPVPPFKGLGDAMREVRAHLGLSQARIADRAGTTPTWLSPFESGRMLPSAVAWGRWLSAVEAVDTTRRDPDWLAALAAKLDEAKTLYAEASSSSPRLPQEGFSFGESDSLVRSLLLMWESVLQVTPGRDMKRRDFVLNTVKAAAALPVAAALPPIDLVGSSSLVEGVIRHTADLREWYRYLPGRVLLPIVGANRTLLVQLAAQASSQARAILAGTLGEAELLLGWINAFDTGDHNAAVRHFIEALAAAKRSADRPLAVLVLAAMSIITRRLDQLRAAEELSTRATELLDGSGSPPTIAAFVHVLSSSTYAKAGDQRSAGRALDGAHAALDQFTADAERDWRGIGMWNPARFAEYEGSALIEASRPQDAEAAIVRGLDQLAPTDSKYRALYLANLAYARVRQGDLDAGCATAAEAVRLAGEAGHALSLDVVWVILDELADHQANPAVVDLKDQLLTVARRTAVRPPDHSPR